MTNIHIPQRLENETFADYKVRRQQSNEANKLNSSLGKGGKTSRKEFRDYLRSEGKMKNVAGGFSQALRNWITQNNQAKLANKE